MPSSSGPVTAAGSTTSWRPSARPAACTKLVFHPYNGNAESAEDGRAATAQFHELIEQAQPLAVDLSMALAAPSWPEYDEGDGFRETPTEETGERREDFGY